MAWDRHDVGGRPLFVWAPPDRSRTYPTVYVLHSHMRSAESWFNVEPFIASYPERIEAIAPDAVVALVDGWTDAGGGLWIGELTDYLRDTVVSFVDERYPTNGLRGLQGKSSGGYGAIVHALERPDLFQAFAAHAPDALFDVTIAHDFPAAARALAQRRYTSMDDFWAAFDGLHDSTDALLVQLGAAARAFGDGELPIDRDTGAPLPAFGAWLEHDPVRLIPLHADAVAQLRGAWLDAGRSDEYFFDLGVVALRRELRTAGLPEDRLRFELFDGGHRGLTPRYPLSLAFLVDSLSITL
jgi:S-formylglutathione hydrolase FrmB